MNYHRYKLFACAAIASITVALAATAPPAAADALNPNHPDRNVQPGVPQGKITPGTFTESKIYPGTRRDYSVYVPAQYSPDKPAALMVFMDGGGYAKVDGAFRVPVVFDNLIHQKAMPVTIARATIACPMLSSTISSMAATG